MATSKEQTEAPSQASAQAVTAAPTRLPAVSPASASGVEVSRMGLPIQRQLMGGGRLSRSPSAPLNEKLSRMPGGTSSVQRQKCACGGEADESGMCAECKAEMDNQQHALQRRVQRKMTVNAPGDAQEQEAEGMARSVVQRIARSIIHRQVIPGIQRQSAEGDVPDVDTETETKIESARGGGQPLSSEVRRSMEGGFNADFSGVRVHTDGNADQLNRSLDARAFTTGQDVFFRQGEYNPGSSGGQELLAHELTHTLQQGGTRQNPDASVQTFRLSAVQLKEEAELLPRRLAGAGADNASTTIQRFGENLLPNMGTVLGTTVPKEPTTAIEKILSALNNPLVSAALNIIPGSAALQISLRAVLGMIKMVQYVIQNKEKYIAEFQNYISTKLDTVEPIVEQKLRALLDPFDERHFVVLWQGYALPMLKHLKDDWWNTIKATLWEQIWPFEGITSVTQKDPEKRTGLGKALAEVYEHIQNGFIEASKANFSKSIDHALLAEKGMMGIVNRFYGWAAIIIIASETIAGAIAGAAAGGAGAGPGAIAGAGAGLATAGSVGEVLLIATVAIDAAILLKSVLSLHNFDSSLVNEEKATANGEYYKQIAESSISITMMLLLLGLAYLGGKIAQALLGKLFKFLPKNLQETLIRFAKLMEKGAKGEKPGAVDSINFRENPPELNPEFVKLREGAKSPENIRSVSDPELLGKYDAEITVGEHVYRRNKSTGTWCRFSEVFCGIKQLDDINVKVDEALGLTKPNPIAVGEQVTVPYKDGLARAKVVEVNDQFVKVQYPSKAKGQGDIIESIPRERFDQMLKDGDAIRWTQERQRLMRSRPKYDDGLVDTVWERAKQPDGKVYDPVNKKELTWDKSKSQWDQWHMGHKPGEEYVKLVDKYVKGEMTYEQFIKEYNNPNHYQPEDPIRNMGHGDEL